MAKCVRRSLNSRMRRSGRTDIPVKLSSTAIALTALLGSTLYLSPVALPQTQQSTVPDAPAPQAAPSLSDMGPITPGKGATATPADSAPSGPSSSSTTQDQQRPAPPTPPPPRSEERRVGK